MSVEAISWAFKAKVGNSNSKLVLLALGNYADDKHECWPGAEALAADTELSSRTVFRCINYLIKQDLITREPRTFPNGGSRTPLYLLNVVSNKAGVSIRHWGMSIGHRGVTRVTQGCDTAVSTKEPSIEPSIEKEGISRNNGCPLPLDWKPKSDHLMLGDQLGLQEAEVLTAAEEMRDWAEGNGRWRDNWDRYFRSWLRRTAKKQTDRDKFRPNNARERTFDALQKLGRGTVGEIVNFRLPKLTDQ